VWQCTIKCERNTPESLHGRTQRLMMRYCSAFFGQREQPLNGLKIFNGRVGAKSNKPGGRPCHSPRLGGVIVEPREACPINPDHGSVARHRQIDERCGHLSKRHWRKTASFKSASRKSPLISFTPFYSLQAEQLIARGWLFALANNGVVRAG
jgi:hypothetical protein